MTLPIAIAALAICDALYMLFRRFDIDYDEGCELPRRWIVWGTCRSLAPGYEYRYFVLRLPSWQWVPDFPRRSYDWGQLTLLRFAGKWHGGYWIRA